MRGFLLASLLLLNGALFVANWLAPIDISSPIHEIKENRVRVPSIQLISELSPQQLAQLEAMQPPPVVPAVIIKPLQPAPEKKAVVLTAPEEPLPPVTQCYQIGPFNSEDELRAVQAQLALYQPRSEVQQQFKTLYWVHLQKPERVEDIDRQIVKLRNHGIKDTWVSSGERYNGAISLGLFKTKSYALKRKETIKKLGFKVQIDEHQKPVNRYWLRWDAEPEADWKQPLQQPLHKRVSLCNTTAESEGTEANAPDSPQHPPLQ